MSIAIRLNCTTMQVKALTYKLPEVQTSTLGLWRPTNVLEQQSAYNQRSTHDYRCGAENFHPGANETKVDNKDMNRVQHGVLIVLTCPFVQAGIGRYMNQRQVWANIVNSWPTICEQTSWKGTKNRTVTWTNLNTPWLHTQLHSSRYDRRWYLTDATLRMNQGRHRVPRYLSPEQSTRRNLHVMTELHIRSEW